MGYSHYWYGQVHLSEELTSDLFTLLLHAEAELCGGDGQGLPEVTAEFVRFNGSLLRGESCEPFAIHDGLNDSLCQTRNYPYDSVVGVALLRIQHHNPAFSIESDGDWESDWDDIRALYEATYNGQAVKPARM